MQVNCQTIQVYVYQGTCIVYMVLSSMILNSLLILLSIARDRGRNICILYQIKGECLNGWLVHVYGIKVTV